MRPIAVATLVLVLLATCFVIAGAVWVGVTVQKKVPVFIKADAQPRSQPFRVVQPTSDPLPVRLPETDYTAVGIPKRIWTMWDSTPLPPFVQLCIDTWRAFHPEFDVQVLTNEMAMSLCPELRTADLSWVDSITRLADVIRAAVVCRYGGVWMDASILLTGPFPRGLAEGLETSPFVAYYTDAHTTRENAPLVENWFFASVPNGAFITAWYRAFMHTAHFSTVDAHLDDAVKRKHIDTQKLGGLSNYLFMNVCAQIVLQSPPSNGVAHKLKDSAVQIPAWEMIVFKAENGPFQYLTTDAGWKDETGVLLAESLIKHQPVSASTIHKYCGGQRRLMTSQLTKHLRREILSFASISGVRRTKTPVKVQRLLSTATPPHVTFVIPSLARPELVNALRSLVGQTCQNWLAIVVFDCVQAVPDSVALDPRVSWLNLDTKTGSSNHAAGVRLHGIRRVTTPWCAFLDDDDVLHPQYVEASLAILNAHTDAVFLLNRALYTERDAIPNKHLETCAELSVGEVTIAQVWRTATLQSVTAEDWRASDCEDFDLFAKLRAQAPANALLLHKCATYAVRMKSFPTTN